MKIFKSTPLVISLCATIFFSLFLTSLDAKVWRLNNRPDIDADFSDLATALSDAEIGDTIYIAGSPTSYGNGTMSKPLVLIGSGIFLDENPITQAYQEDAEIGALTLDFTTSSTRAVVSGLRIGGDVLIYTSNITIQRCNIIDRVIFYDDASNIILEQCFIRPTYQGGAAVIDIGVAEFSDKDFDNIIIRNNYIYAYTKAIAIDLKELAPTTITLQNNVFDGRFSGNISVEHTIVINNIQIKGTFSGTNSLVAHNLGHADQFGTSDGNQENIDMATVFQNVDGTVDKDFQLKANSPAIGAGSNGGDCGIFSSDSNGNPYILSGLPAIPSIHAITVPDVGFNTLNINVKSVTRN